MRRSIIWTAAFALGAFGCGPPDIEPTVAGGVLRFELPNLDGETVSHTDDRFDGKVVLVDIWGTWCPPCRESVPQLVEWQKAYRDDGLAVVGIAFEHEDDADARRSNVREFAEQFDVNYTVLDGGFIYEVEDALPALEGFQGFPTMIIIGRDGKVAHANTVLYPDEKATIHREVKKALAVERH